MNRAHRQEQYDLRFDWGPVGADALAPQSEVAVVVDVLSFTTTLSVALDRGTSVIPWPTRDDSARRLAHEHGAALAVGRSVAQPGEISLSPATLRNGTPPPRLVLPSPNGSTIASRLSDVAGTCIGGSLRNAAAVGSWIASTVPSGGAVSVIAAGERWPNGELRPSIEDLWGAGLILAELTRLAPERSLSPEARMAVVCWEAISSTVADGLRTCASGRELIEAGFGIDVDIAAEANSSRTVPVLRDGVFVDVTGISQR
ncbi:2-phosphosulfolactate phosphatase [Rhodococcoides kyotonense]|uniref:Probable 2-phosphosulfolactate phosphatase n=1 Tax=Rhodococcoides kyotonense TaxID=398843 RepID=A0A239D511_9NOCA|nr:2-phosphosulfolactate phosphatase [Rhodococcus kyotonensis]SNS27505.1 2-phosphosulfolactate phosphatase [Rhodococcus kyotonensis]